MATNCACKGKSRELLTAKIAQEGLKCLGKCSKCNENEPVINSRGKTCRECFIKFVSRIFRSNLRTKCIEKGEYKRNFVILGDSGINTVTLLHMLLCRNNDRDIKLSSEVTEHSGVNCSSRRQRLLSETMEGQQKEPSNNQFNDESCTSTVASKGNLETRKAGKVDSDTLKKELERIISHKIVSVDDLTLASILHVNLIGDLSTVSKSFTSVISSTFSSVLGADVCPENLIDEKYIVQNIVLGSVNVTCLNCCYFLHAPQIGAKKEECPAGDEYKVDANEMAHTCNERCRLLQTKLIHLYKTDKDGYTHISNILRNKNTKEYISREITGSIYVMTPETQDNICNTILFLTCTGNGGVMACKTAFSDKHTLDGHATLVRPLKSISSKEVAFYHRLNGLSERNFFYDGTSNSVDQGFTTRRVDEHLTSMMDCINSFTTYINNIHLNTFHNITNVTNKLVQLPMSETRCKVCGENSPGDPSNGTMCDVCLLFCKRNLNFRDLINVIVKF
ncbi:hypothetical protein BEWA_003250 [Theileria equi strain WA]|uniref:Cytoplasmic tRNA 2-thiolation protein 2 n=1 Tax=Theileria equi strain WA TaxID=1537102 RepID=L0AZB3_THEEQ|nr:hypothetical protein BEWA_003250 [Theileria equi strain WA]AFZ80917.1 hypothetical protein BEWA_003250 [Theileria equi strain WA]|eukprot:XP_004830583.1 hypothetical protein BEWA_003250 [Theileria equi strain WA]